MEELRKVDKLYLNSEAYEDFQKELITYVQEKVNSIYDEFTFTKRELSYVVKGKYQDSHLGTTTVILIDSFDISVAHHFLSSSHIKSIIDRHLKILERKNKIINLLNS